MYKRILLGYDGSETSLHALLDSREIAQWSHAELVLVSVMLPPITPLGFEGGPHDEALQTERYRSILDAGVQRLMQAGLQVRGELLAGDPVQELAKAASRLQADLIVVGHKHLDGWAASWWRGSVSTHLIEHAPCSVLVVITR